MTVPLLCSELYDFTAQGELVELGVIKAAHGIKGEVKVEVATDSPRQRFGKAGTT